ncbi:DNA-binding response regulator [Nitrospira sp. KM1]|uniref:response regulator transcription factor n=1 Tax=Nitrospira sp. KM1 TaxID=1936990 RepID=UPI0013A74C75|nr:response regulator transcription factor [Nitrospira sp. KM1]BCA52893.1 DNA-binding response regulator [Nitrospira sp. KM1]
MLITSSKKILIVEDDTNIRDLIQMYLEKEGFRTLTAGEGAEAIEQARSGHPDMVILDLMLPGIDGIEVCKRLQLIPQTSRIPIIMLTAKSEELDVVLGLELGADDYVTKPFSPRALVARIKSVLHRLERATAQEAKPLQYGSLSLYTSRHEVTVDGREVTLTSKEFGLLEHLLKNPGRLMTRDILMNNVWGYDYHGTSRTVDVHVARLKQKLPMLCEAIVAVKSLGYKFRDTESAYAT